MERKVPLAQSIQRKERIEGIETTKIYLCYDDDDLESCNVARDLISSLKGKGVDVYSQDTEKAKECGFVVSLLPSTQELTPDHEQEIFHCMYKEKMEGLIFTMAEEVDYHSSSRIKEVIANRIYIGSIKKLVTEITKCIDPKCLLKVTNQTQYEVQERRDFKVVVLFKKEETQSILCVAVILDKNEEKKKVNTWAENNNFSSDHTVTNRVTKDDSNFLKIQVSEQDNEHFGWEEKMVSWQEIETNVSDSHRFWCSSQNVKAGGKKFVIQLQGGLPKEFTADFN